MRDLLRKFDMADALPQMTLMSSYTMVGKDEDGKEVDQKVYRGLYIHFQVSPRASHCTAVKRILRYIKFTPEFGLWYFVDSSLSLLSFSDADYAGCYVECKFNLVFVYLFRLLSRKQTSVSLSTCEAEYIAASSCCSQILWMLATLKYYGLTYGRISLLCDSSSAISVAKNSVLHSRTKNIDVRYHFLRDNYEKGTIDLVKVESEKQVVGEGVDKALIKGEIEGLKCTESGLSSWL
ncbi:LOW QUALITY PROTEIN: hypothetical protein U9M48_012874 [Paspalum notatum var. saurae]|uniref:Uncharacterized protein n=1 Tax=Paspalum notatum var. saurae TaxID=547442 RepID=A0AAQ3SZ93_PASNO